MEPVKRDWGVIETIRWRPQSPNPVIVIGAPLAWSTEIILMVEAILLKRGVLGIQTRNRQRGIPTANGAICDSNIPQFPHRHYASPDLHSSSQLFALWPFPNYPLLSRWTPNACPPKPWTARPISPATKPYTAPTALVPFPAPFAQGPHVRALPPTSILLPKRGWVPPQPAQITLAPHCPSRAAPRGPCGSANQSFPSYPNATTGHAPPPQPFL